MKILNFWCVLFCNYLEQLDGMQNIYKGANSQVVSATFLNIWPPVLQEKKNNHTRAHLRANTYICTVYIERMKQSNWERKQAVQWVRSAPVKWWYVAKDPWSTQSTRGPWTTENALQATKGISAGSYITHQYPSGAGVHHHKLWNTGYWNIQTPGFPRRNDAFSSTKPEHIALQYWEYETQPCLLGGLCCTSKICWASQAATGVVEGGVCLSSAVTSATVQPEITSGGESGERSWHLHAC